MFAKVGDVTGFARVRVLPPLPWKFDFSPTPVNAPPLTWLGAVDFDALFALQSAPGAEVHVTCGVVGHDAVALGVTTFAPPAFVWTTD